MRTRIRQNVSHLEPNKDEPPSDDHFGRLVSIQRQSEDFSVEDLRYKIFVLAGGLSQE